MALQINLEEKEVKVLIKWLNALKILLIMLNKDYKIFDTILFKLKNIQGVRYERE